MVHNHIAIPRALNGVRCIVGNSASKCCGQRQSACLHMVFHVIPMGMGQHNVRLSSPNHRDDLCEILLRILDLEIVADGRIVLRSQESRRVATFLLPNHRCFRAARRHRPAASVGDVHVMHVPTEIAQTDQCSCSNKFNIVGVSKNREHRRHLKLSLQKTQIDSKRLGQLGNFKQGQKIRSGRATVASPQIARTPCRACPNPHRSRTGNHRVVA